MKLRSFWTRVSFSWSLSLLFAASGLTFSRLLLFGQQPSLRLSPGSNFGTALPSTTARCATNRPCHLESTTPELWEAFASSPTSSGAFSYHQGRPQFARWFVSLLPSR